MTEPAETPEAWYQRTGHCHGCGQPGSFCVCRKRCGCADLHEVGSGLAPDALDQFSDTPTAVVSEDQAAMW